MSSSTTTAVHFPAICPTSDAAGHPHPQQGPRIRKKACAHCRHAHAACDGMLPCQRCVAAGMEAHCEYLPSKKRGRPPKAESERNASSLTASAKRRTKRRTYESWSDQSYADEHAFSSGQEGRDATPYDLEFIQSMSGMADVSSSSTSSSRSSSPVPSYHQQSADETQQLSRLILEQLHNVRTDSLMLREEIHSLRASYQSSMHRVEQLEQEMMRNMTAISSLLTVSQRDTRPTSPPSFRESSTRTGWTDKEHFCSPVDSSQSSESSPLSNSPRTSCPSLEDEIDYFLASLNSPCEEIPPAFAHPVSSTLECSPSFNFDVPQLFSHCTPAYLM